MGNDYIKAIGPVKRPDPLDEEEDDVAQVIEEKPKQLDSEDEDAFEEFDLSDEDAKQQKKMDIQKKMWERRMNRKSTKKITKAVE